MVVRSLASAGPLAFFLLLGGCGDGATGPIAISAVGGEPRIANPSREPLDPPSALLLEATAQGLVRFDAGGEIEPALAQRWIVLDDGLRYIFRLRKAAWSGRDRVSSEQVVARLRAAAAPASRNSLKPVLGAIDEIVALPDVIEISLQSPRPSFLQLLAQPEMPIVRGGQGTGPYRAERQPDGSVRLSLPGDEEEDEDKAPPILLLRGERAAAAVARFGERQADLVLGGTLGDLPLARAAGTPAAQLRFDPVSGLFGLAFIAPEGAFARMETRHALAMALDRPALAAALGVPGLQARESLLPPGIEGLTQVSAPAWIRDPLPARQAGRPTCSATRAKAAGWRSGSHCPTGPATGCSSPGFGATGRRSGSRHCASRPARPRTSGSSTKWLRPASQAGICAISPANRAGCAIPPPTR